MISTAFAKAFDSIDRPGDRVPMDTVKKLLKKVRKTVEFFHKSPNGANLLGEILAATIEDHGLSPFSKLAQAIHQRWGSLVKSLISFIERYDALRTAFQNCNKDWEITVMERTALVEMISVLMPVRDIIVKSQANCGGLVPYMVTSLTQLRTETLNSEVPLEILDPVVMNAAKKVNDSLHGPILEVNADLRVLRNHSDLTAIGKATRDGMNYALSSNKRFFDRYTKGGCCKSNSHLGALDVIPVFHPYMKKLKFMDLINKSDPDYVAGLDDEWLVNHKLRIKNYIIYVMVIVINHENLNKVERQEIRDNDIDNSVPKRQKINPFTNRKVVEAMRKSGAMEVDSDEDEEVIVEATPLELATSEYNLYMNTKTSQSLQESLSTSDGLIHYWNHAGLKSYPFLAKVALSQLATPAGSAVLENDFSTFANLVTRHRSNLDPAIVEMILFCKLNASLIPNIIPRISEAKITENIPIKLRDPIIQQALRLMNAEEIDEDEDSDPDVDDNI